MIFVIGVPTNSSEDLEHINEAVQKKIEEEFFRFGDILQVRKQNKYSNVSQSYFNSLGG